MQRLREGSPQGDDGAADVEPDLRWVWRLWAVVVVFAAVAIWRSAVMGIPFRDPRGEWLSHRVAFTAGISLVLVLVDGGWRAWQGERSLRGTPAAIRRRWTGRRVALLLAGLAAYHAIYFSYHNLKSWWCPGPPTTTSSPAGTAGCSSATTPPACFTGCSARAGRPGR